MTDLSSSKTLEVDPVIGPTQVEREGLPHATTLISLTGNIGFEFLVQRDHENAAFLETVTGIDKQIFQHQGSDFFCASLYTHTAGTFTMNAALMASHKMGMSKTADFMNKNYNILRTAVGFSELCLYELFQAGGNLTKIDLADIAAYGLGVATITYGRNIVNSFKNTVSDVFGKDANKHVDPKQKQTLTP